MPRRSDGGCGIVRVEFVGQRVGDQGDDARAGGPGEQLRHGDDRQFGRAVEIGERRAQPVEVLRAGAASRLGQP